VKSSPGAVKLHFAPVAKYDSRRGYRWVARLDHRHDPQLVRHAIKLRKQLRIRVLAKLICTLLWWSIAAKHLAQFAVAILLAQEFEVRLPVFSLGDRLE
jgi:hypothetical protein